MAAKDQLLRVRIKRVIESPALPRFHFWQLRGRCLLLAYCPSTVPGDEAGVRHVVLTG